MQCSEFLDRYTDFHDGALAPEESERFRVHMTACATCQRYDEVLIRGVDLLRALSETRPGEDFRARLRHSIYMLEEERRRRRLLRSNVRTVPLLGALAAFGAIVVGLSLGEAAPVVDLPPIVAARPSPGTGAPRPLPLPSSLLLPDPARSPLAGPSGVRVPGASRVRGRAVRVSAPAPELWTGANELLYRSSSLYLRYREPGFVRTTGLR